MEQFFGKYAEVVNAVTLIVTAASIIVRFTPTKKDDAVVGKVQKFFELLALNKR